MPKLLLGGRIGLLGWLRIGPTVGRVPGYGTGSLVSPRLLLTNHHVLPDAATAAAGAVEFDVQDGPDGRPLDPVPFDLTPGDLFLTDPVLDFTLVAVAPTGAAGAALEDFGWNRACEDDDPVLVDERVNIVQHPGGQPKQVALRDNRVVDVLEDFLHYRADTEPGSSGAPVFNDQWELVALHHSGVPRRDASGRVLTRGNVVWSEAMGERAVDWIANEGTRLSRVLARLKAERLEGEARRLRDALFAAEPGRVPRPRTPPHLPAHLAPKPSPAAPPQAPPAPASIPLPAATVPEPGMVRLTIPLQIEVELRVVGPGAVPPPRRWP